MTDLAIVPAGPAHVFTLLCDDIRQEMGGKTSLMGLYDAHVVVPQLPFTLPKLCFFTRFKNLEGNWIFSFSIKSPSGDARKVIEGSEVVMPEGSKDGTFNVVASPFEVTEDGIYEAEMGLQSGEDLHTFVFKFAVSDANRLQAEYMAAQTKVQEEDDVETTPAPEAAPTEA
jgi:hypothetical protein